MRTNTLQCEDCKHELMEHDPAADSVGGQEKMQAFNIATQPIRDSLKRLEGLTLPSFNIMAWIAQNVVTEVVGIERAEGEEKKVQVIIGGEEREMLERERLQEAQRYVPIRAFPSCRASTHETSGCRMLCQSGIHIRLSRVLQLHSVSQIMLDNRRRLPTDADLSGMTMRTKMICLRHTLRRWTKVGMSHQRTSRPCQIADPRLS